MRKIYGCLATLNFSLPFVGYVLITSLFLTDMESSMGELSSVSQAITIPYRLFAMVIAVVVIILSPKRKSSKIPKSVLWLFVFWLLLIIRMMFDLWIRSDLQSIQINTYRTLLYIPVCLLPAIAVLYSHKQVNYKLAFHLVFWGFVLSLVLMLVNNPLLLLASDEVVQRVAGNVAFSSLQLATFGASIIIMCYCAYKNHYYNIILLVVLTLFAVIVLLRAASRGPLVAFVISFSIYFISKFKHPVKSSLFLLLLLFLVFIFSDYIMELFENVSPVLVDRLSVEDGDDFTNGRASLYKVAFEKFISSPIWGDSFAIFANDPIAAKYGVHVDDMSDSGYIWSHNMVLDAFMGLGLIGGVIFTAVYVDLFKKSFKLFKQNDSRIWFVLLTLLRVVAGFFSGAFYLNDTLTFCIVVVFLLWQENLQIINPSVINK